jgi:hypothetical protein
MAKFLTVNSKYNPYTLAELIQPIQYLDAQHKATEAEYDALLEQLGPYASILTTDPNSQAANDYRGYQEALNAGVNILSSEGLTPEVRQSLRALKNNYNTTIKPIEEAYSQRKAEIERQQRIEDAAKGRVVFSRNARNTNLDDYVNMDDSKLEWDYTLLDDVYNSAYQQAFNEAQIRYQDLLSEGVDEDTALQIIADGINNNPLYTSNYTENDDPRLLEEVSRANNNALGALYEREKLTRAQRIEAEYRNQQMAINAARFRAEMASHGLTEEGKIDPTNTTYWDLQGYEFDDKGNLRRKLVPIPSEEGVYYDPETSLIVDLNRNPVNPIINNRVLNSYQIDSKGGIKANPSNQTTTTITGKSFETQSPIKIQELEDAGYKIIGSSIPVPFSSSYKYNIRDFQTREDIEDNILGFNRSKISTGLGNYDYSFKNRQAKLTQLSPKEVSSNASITNKVNDFIAALSKYSVNLKPSDITVFTTNRGDEETEYVFAVPNDYAVIINDAVQRAKKAEKKKKN